MKNLTLAERFRILADGGRLVNNILLAYKFAKGEITESRLISLGRFDEASPFIERMTIIYKNSAGFGALLQEWME